MKTKHILRVLSLLAFLLLIAPFYDSCNGQRMLRQVDAIAEPMIDTTAIAVDSTVVDSTEIANTEIDTINQTDVYEESFASKAYGFIDDDESESALEFSEFFVNVVRDFNFKKFKQGMKEKDWYKGLIFNFKNCCFLIISLLTIINVVLSFSKKEKWIYKLSVFNLILLTLTVICIFSEGLFEELSQIKWGYYAFIITNLLIFHYSKKSVTPT